MLWTQTLSICSHPRALAGMDRNLSGSYRFSRSSVHQQWESFFAHYGQPLRFPRDFATVGFCCRHRPAHPVEPVHG